MLRPWGSLLFLIAFISSSTVLGKDFVPGEVLVKYKKGTLRARNRVNALYDSVGVEDVHRFSNKSGPFELLVLKNEELVPEALVKLGEDPAVEYVQPNYRLRFMPIVRSEDSDPFEFPSLRLETESPRPRVRSLEAEEIPYQIDPKLSKLYGMKKIGAFDAWEVSPGSKSVIVADIDTGIDYNHEDLAFNVWRNPESADEEIVGYDFVHKDSLPYDDNGHGTHTAGTIGAVGGNGIGISGVAQRVSLMALKFLSHDGEGTTADAIRAIDYAIAHGAKILNISWGSPGNESETNRLLLEAFERAKEKGVLFVTAAGNEGVDNDTSGGDVPANFALDNQISVAASDADDELASFSNYGKGTTHLAAPGVDIFSTIPDGKYSKMSGSSMACPHVVGAAALLWAVHPTWNYRQIKAAILKSVDKEPGLKHKVMTGGRLNISRALAWGGQAGRIGK